MQIKEKTHEKPYGKHPDSEQEDFFKRVYQIKQICQDGFDMVINREYLRDAGVIAGILATAFKEKFNTGDAVEQKRPSA